MRTVSIVDYGIGNLHSVARALQRVGALTELITEPERIVSADLLVLPGVGAFEPCISNVRKAGLVEPIVEFARSGKPFLGICVGMQLLFDYSSEFGRHEGLGLIAGGVQAIPPRDDNGQSRKVPHIGWSSLLLPGGRSSWKGTLLEDAVPQSSSAYFVHSYSGMPLNESDRLADADHEGFRVCAAVEKDNITGFQCHPEKSGPVGLAVLKRFVDA